MPVANFATYASVYSIKNSFYFICQNIFTSKNKLKLQFLVKKNWDWTHDLSVTRQPSCLLFHHKGLRGNGMFCKQERSFVAYLFCMWQTSINFSTTAGLSNTVALLRCGTVALRFDTSSETFLKFWTKPAKIFF